MILHLLEVGIVVSVGYAIYKHVGLATIKADVASVVAKIKAEESKNPLSTVLAAIKADLAKYL
jgi:hypothetical protein